MTSLPQQMDDQVTDHQAPRFICVLEDLGNESKDVLKAAAPVFVAPGEQLLRFFTNDGGEAGDSLLYGN